MRYKSAAVRFTNSSKFPPQPRVRWSSLVQRTCPKPDEIESQLNALPNFRYLDACFRIKCRLALVSSIFSSGIKFLDFYTVKRFFSGSSLRWCELRLSPSFRLPYAIISSTIEDIDMEKENVNKCMKSVTRLKQIQTLFFINVSTLTSLLIIFFLYKNPDSTYRANKQVVLLDNIFITGNLNWKESLIQKNFIVRNFFCIKNYIPDWKTNT